MTIGVLVVEDDSATGTVYSRLLFLAYYRVVLATTYAEGLKALDEAPMACILDVMLPDGSGVDLAREALRRNPDCICIVMTAGFADAIRAEVLAMGAAACLQKPVEWDELFGLLPKPLGPEVRG